MKEKDRTNVRAFVLPSHHMKQLIAGIVIILVLGIGAFLYRAVLEHPVSTATTTDPVACTLEAKICPDGTSVGRTGPNCEFAACAFPNAEDAAIGLGFVVPAGYTANPDAIGADQTLRAVFDKPSKGSVPHSIIIRRYAIPEGKTATDVMLANTIHESSGEPVNAMSEFKPKIVEGRTYQCITVERFEGQVHTVCYLARTTDVLRFEVLEKDVDWTNPSLVIDSLPEHKALYSMLATVQTK